jgi:hypothetical protein
LIEEEANMTSYGAVPNSLSKDVEDNENYQSFVVQNGSVESSNVTDKKSRFAVLPLIIAIVVAAALGVAGFSSYNYAYRGQTTELAKQQAPQPLFRKFPRTTATLSADITQVLITASNEYGVFSGPYPWMADVAGTQLVEPYKDTTLTLSGTYVDAGIYTFNWIIDGVDTSEFDATETTQTIMMTKPGKKYVMLQVLDSDKNVVAEYETIFWCK